MGVRSVGVEEELLLVEPDTGRPRAVAAAVLAAGGAAGARGDGSPGNGHGGPEAEDLDYELQLQQVETSTRPCGTLGELEGELRRARAAAADAAGRVGVQIAALGTSPLPVEPETVGQPRYQRMAEAFGLTAQEQLTCGCHVHVQVDSAEEGVAVLDRIQPWLAVVLALSANSPFWQGLDSSYASFRYQAWGRWPCSGPTEWFGSAEAYQATVEQMVRTGTLLDTGMVYFDARLSEHYPTVEVRIADVCLRHEDAVLIAALVRALVETEARAWQQDAAPLRMRAELLRLAAWRASRSGLDGELIDPRTGRPGGTAAVTALLLAHVRGALADAGDLGTVTGLLADVLRRGSGAAFQRDVLRRTGNLRDVVASAAGAVTR
ncbi:MAG TPA: glutamate--cysteine ligase [Streptosporangiaceae bacterium]|nr:glutamate--cysteine ligase [Streptosporangiaceae bacterium]